MKNRNPNVRIMTAEQARRLNIMPADKRSKEGRRSEQEKAMAGDGRLPPVAVVHGNPSDVRGMPNITLASE